MLLSQLQKDFSLSRTEAISFIFSAPNRYKIYKIKKRHGGEREIAEPTKSLKSIQKWAVRKYLEGLNISPSAVAYVKNKNIKNFAFPHVNNKYLLKLDFKDFFNSIIDTDFINFCKENLPNLSNEEVYLLSHIFFCKNKKSDNLYLSIGSPSSPLISNFIMILFDEAILDFCNQNNISYTRYADDLAFSTNTPNILNTLINKIDSICSEIKYPHNLKINKDKTVFTSKKHNRTLTGLVISNDGKISIGRDKKRKLRAEAHKASLGLLEQDQLEKFKGKLAFLMSIDPDFSNFLKFKAKL